MKKYLLIVLFAVMYLQEAGAQDNSTYNKHLADSLGADDYGMKTYIFVLLKSGSNTTATKETSSIAFRAHMDNMEKMVANKQLIIAGPFMKNDKGLRGLFIFDVKTKDEALILLQTDPAIKEKLLEADVFEWYGSAALPVYLETSKKIAKKNP